MYYKLICILYALLCGQNFILVKSGCYKIFRGAMAHSMSLSLDLSDRIIATQREIHYLRTRLTDIEDTLRARQRM
jgi:hypothetical protein